MVYFPSNIIIERLRGMFKRRVRDSELAYLGDTHGAGARVDVPGKIGFVYIHFPNGKDENGFARYSDPTIARSGNAAYLNAPGMPVYVAYNDSGELEIKGAQYAAIDQAGFDTRVLNPLNQQSKFVYIWQITIGLANAVANSVTTSFLVTIKSFYHYTGNRLQKVETPLAADKIDLSSYIPATDMHCYAAVWIDAYTNLPVVTTSVAQATTSPLTAADLQELVVRTASSRPADGIPLKAFYLANDQGTITQSARDVDLRQFLDNPQALGFPNVLETLERVWPNRTLVTGPYTTSGVGAITLEAGAQHIIVHKGNLSATTDPTVNDDSGDGYSIGSPWFNKSTGILYIASSVTVGAAVWTPVAGFGAASPPFVDTTAIVKGSADATKLLRFEVDGFTTGTTRVMTPPNYDGTLATLAGTEAFTNKTINNSSIGVTTAAAGYFSDLRLLVGGFVGMFTHSNTATRLYTLPNYDGVLTTQDGVESLTNKIINSSSIGATSQGLGYFNALRLIIGGFSGIFTHANTGTRTYTLPNFNGTLSTLAGTETLSGKTLTSPTIADFANAQHNHTNAAGGGQLTGAAVNVTAHNAVIGDGASGLTSLAPSTARNVMISDGTDWTSRALALADVPNLIAIMRDEKTTGTNGGTSVNTTWNARDLNTELYDPDGIVSISSNQFTPIAGDYEITVFSPYTGGAAAASAGRARLYNVTGAAAVEEGMSTFAPINGNGLAHLHCKFTANGTTAYRIDLYTSVGRATNGLGVQVGDGSAEVYTSIMLRKVA